MLTRRDVLSTLAAGSIVGGFRPLSPPARVTLSDSSLAASAAKSGRLYGCAVASGELTNEAFVPVLRREARVLVAEYEMKRRAITPKPGIYDFAAADILLRFARASRMAFRGHTLVWHKANPPWLAEAVSGTQQEMQLTGYIEKVAGRYRGQMHSWDVINEALAPEDGRSDALRKSMWLNAFGPSYIDQAFHAARAADPHAMLVYNDWGCEGAGTKHDVFRAATLRFLEKAKGRGVPIDAYGMQGHLQAFGPAVDQPKLRKFLDDVTSLGLHVLITEHDVDDSGGPANVLERDRAVADASRRFLDVVLDCSATLAVLTWGLSDRFVDPPGWKAASEGYSPRPLPLDTSFARKPMWSAMETAFGGAQRSLTRR